MIYLLCARSHQTVLRNMKENKKEYAKLKLKLQPRYSATAPQSCTSSSPVHIYRVEIAGHLVFVDTLPSTCPLPLHSWHIKLTQMVRLLGIVVRALPCCATKLGGTLQVRLSLFLACSFASFRPPSHSLFASCL